MCRADNFTTFMCRLSWNLGALISWNPQGLSRPVMGLLYIYWLRCSTVSVEPGMVSVPCNADLWKVTWGFDMKICPFIKFVNFNTQKIILHKVSVYLMIKFRYVRRTAKENNSFVMPVRPSVFLSTWESSVPTRRIFMKFEIWWLFGSLSREFKFH
jgi:hypothetical protein